MNIDFSKFEKVSKIVFNDKDLLKQAFIHRSYINENKNLGLDHNERLEFLGDAVLELVITDYLYKKYNDKTEGDLTSYRSALVNANTLSQVASNLNMNEFLLLSRGETKDVGRARQYILANTFEAFVGAVYLDKGYDEAKKFIEENVSPLIDEIIEKRAWIDAKSLFQEKAQDETGITPAYKTIKESGPDHSKMFTVAVMLGKEQVALGEGESKQDAEQNAARYALKKKGWK